MKIPWEKWNNNYPVGRPIAFGKADKQEIDEILRQYGRRAKEMMEEKHYDHVLYAIKYFGFGKKRVKFFLQPMKNDEFNDLFGYQEKNTMVYAVHNPNMDKKYPKTAEIDLDADEQSDTAADLTDEETEQFWQTEKKEERKTDL